MTLGASLDHAFRNVARLSNGELKSRLVALVQRDRRVTAELLVHLGEVDARRLHASWAFSSLFRYCVKMLGFSEDEAYKRITAARVVRKFPAALELVLSGKLHLSGLLVVAPGLKFQNHSELLGAACGKTKRQVGQLMAERFPRPDVPASVRRLPVASPDAAGTKLAGPDAAAVRLTATAARATASTDTSALPALNAPPSVPPSSGSAKQADAPAVVRTGRETFAQDKSAQRQRPFSCVAPRTSDRPHVEPLAPRRYRVTFTASAELVQKLERAQELASHAVPPSDIAALFERALEALIAREEKRRFAARPTRTPTTSGRPSAAVSKLATELAPGRVLDESAASSKPDAPDDPRDEARESRCVAAHVRRGVSERDGGRCTFVDPETGRRCDERRFLEVEHKQPHALGGPPTMDNMVLLCRAHNALTARRVFGEQYIAAAAALGRGEPVSHERRR